jgi:hypothetical protein
MRVHRLHFIAALVQDLGDQVRTRGVSQESGKVPMKSFCDGHDTMIYIMKLRTIIM